jgi:hypothetical protein
LGPGCRVGFAAGFGTTTGSVTKPGPAADDIARPAAFATACFVTGGLVTGGNSITGFDGTIVGGAAGAGPGKASATCAPAWPAPRHPPATAIAVAVNRITAMPRALGEIVSGPDTS